MKTDSIFYKLFNVLPGTFFELIGQSPEQVKNYEFVSEEIKQTSFRIDGIFKPRRKNSKKHLYFTEVQFQKKDDFYWRFFTEISLYLYQKQPPQDWRGIVLFPKRSIESERPKHYQEFFDSGRVRCLYLNELNLSASSSVGLKAIQLIVQKQPEINEAVRELISEARQNFENDTLTETVLELIETIIVYKFPNVSYQELQAMFELADLKKTRIYQEIKEEVKEEAKEETELETKLKSVPGLLAIGVTVEQIAAVFGLDVEVVKKAAENYAADSSPREDSSN